MNKITHIVMGTKSGDFTQWDLLEIEKVANPVVDVLNLNNFIKYNEY